jgi:hypothetical protein
MPPPTRDFHFLQMDFWANTGDASCEPIVLASIAKTIALRRFMVLSYRLMTVGATALANRALCGVRVRGFARPGFQWLRATKSHGLLSRAVRHKSAERTWLAPKRERKSREALFGRGNRSDAVGMSVPRLKYGPQSNEGRCAVVDYQEETGLRQWFIDMTARPAAETGRI